MAALLLAGALTAGCDTDAASAQNTGGRDTVTNSGNAPACSYATLSPEDQRRYKSRYERRVRTEGREFAEAWVRDRFCPPPEVQARRDAAKARGPVDRNGQPCTRTRAEMRAVTSMDGSMTMIPHQVCAD
ncbi:hypothetical protein GRI97_06545 [Altererythrobacter xixiisoli]|uniref:Uncharacterized protein n=1 Tax=Croceibacterium xixiisoli TaxID=1476466 RepID=A0A6I4TRR8_9SPHN|nr:hypothetical protein [Croceibacterium xixiisoli]MXO98646.1 hypothetical protein [Croceibacterium xixiisoli]